MKKITEFQIRISPDSVCSMLNADRSLLADEMREELEEMLSEAYERLEPAAYLGFGDTEGFLYGEDQLPGQEALYVICTVGERLSSWSSELFRQGDCVRAMLADAAADNCLFQLDGQLREQISALCREHGRGIRRRLEAPQDAPMRIQKKALDVTGAAQYGIGITEGFMYRPVKSVCQVYLLSENPEENNSEHDCSRCPNTSCRMRRSPGDVTEPSVTVITGEGQRTLPFVRGKSILEILRENGIYIAALCSGRGTCGKCRIRVTEGTLPVAAEDRLFFEEAELEAGFRLACTAFPEGACTVLIPDLAEEKEFYVPDIGGKETAADWPDRTQEGKGSEEAALKRDGRAAACEAAPGRGGGVNAGEYGIAVDIGTTTVAMQLIDLRSGKIMKAHTALNIQRMYGADVIGRIEAAVKGSAGELKECIRQVLQSGVDSLTEGGHVPVSRMVIGANTAMVHLLMGYPCESPGIFPFRTYNIQRIETAWDSLSGQKGLSFPVRICPGVSAYIGGDITAGLYALGFHERERVSVLIDLGTNGEMAVGNRERILAASAAAGPAFEGGNLACGTGSIPGAVCHAAWKDGTLCVETIGGEEPTGICGTGILEIIACLLEAELMDETGRLEEPYASEGFPVDEQGRIRVFQKDIREIQLAKAAVRAGLETLLDEYGTAIDEVDEIFLAGGFGYELDIGRAEAVGLLPAGCAGRVRAAGNTCLKGAAAGLLDGESGKKLDYIAGLVQEIPLSGNPKFSELYMEYMCFGEEE